MKKLAAINRKTVLKFLGYEAELIGPELMEKIDALELELLSNIHPRYICKAFDLDKADGKVSLKDCDLLLPGEKISRELYYCSKAALFCATLSDDIDLLISLAGREDIERAVILDCLAAAALEEYCDLVEEDIASRFPEYQITFRFSPLYGDLPQGTESDFTAILDSGRKIGVSYSENGVFTPRFSITAIIGLKEK